jgi:nitrous oxidase accessory protein
MWCVWGSGFSRIEGQRCERLVVDMHVFLILVAALVIAAPVAAQDHLVAPGALEGRPEAAASSPLQRLIDEAAPGATLTVPAGRYVGDLLIDKPLRLVGQGRPLLVGSGGGSVVRIRADDVLVEGFDIDGQRGGDLGRDSSGVHVAARRATIRDCRIRESLFGVYLREADGAAVERCVIVGIPGRDPGEKGSGIHAFNSLDFRFIDNRVVDVRDGLYLQNSSRGVIRRNVVSNMRYGVHYMFSDDNTFEDNTFENGAAGAAIMYSERILFARNRFLHNRGFASVGLLLQQCDDVVAEENLIGDNARGVFLEGTIRTTFRRNVIAQSDIAVVMFDSADQTLFEGNLFVGNMSPLQLVGKRTNARFEGNYWSDNREPDLDGDGRSDRPYRLTSVFDHFRGNLTAADLFVDGFAATALSAAEEAFPIIETASVFDARPLAAPPALPGVPAPERPTGPVDAGAVSAAGLTAAAGLVVLSRGRRPGRVRPQAPSPRTTKAGPGPESKAQSPKPGEGLPS